MPSTNAIQKQILDGAQIRIDKQSEIPVHKQIVEQIIVLIATGRLEQGEPLPTVRQLGRQKKIHYNTVSRAFKELVAEGWLLRQSGRALKVGSLDSAEAPPHDPFGAPMWIQHGRVAPPRRGAICGTAGSYPDLVH